MLKPILRKNKLEMVTLSIKHTVDLLDVVLIVAYALELNDITDDEKITRSQVEKWVREYLWLYGEGMDIFMSDAMREMEELDGKGREFFRSRIGHHDPALAHVGLPRCQAATTFLGRVITCASVT